MTRSHQAPSYEFGPFRLDPAERLLLRTGQPVALKPKAFDLLVFLVERPGRLIPKQELLEALWAGTFAGGSESHLHRVDPAQGAR